MDALERYRWAVQDPETHAEVLRIMYSHVHSGRHASVLREDFAGTAAESVAWVALWKGRRAVAVDHHGPTLAWAKQRAERILGSQAENIEFIEADVMETGPPQAPAADILSVLNFSLFYFHKQETLRMYLAHANRCLAPGGLLVLNMFGGAESMRIRTDTHWITPTPRLPTETAIPPFEYIWEQRSYNAETEILDCRIHFNVPTPGLPGSIQEIRDAFQYEFRLWHPREIIEALHVAGFDHVEVWRHTYDAEKGAAGVFLGPVPISEVEALEHWTVYIVATHTAPDLLSQSLS